MSPAGEKVYAQHCVACHQATGRSVPPAFPPLAGSKVVTGPEEAQSDVQPAEVKARRK